MEESEAEAEAHAEIADDLGDVETRVNRLDRQGNVEDELRALKDRLMKERKG